MADAPSIASTSIIISKDLSYNYISYDDNGTELSREALGSVDLDIKKGDFIAILGRNGSGKSTLAKHMNAILTPTSGDMIVNGFNTRDESHLYDIRQSVGMVFQNPDNQIIATTVEDDVAFGPENLGVAPEEIRRRVDEAIETVGLAGYEDTSPHFLSGGQKQRVAIAGILAMRPICIVFDEPTAMLDPIGRREVINTARRLNKDEGITIILITHFMEEAVTADRVYIMDGGKIVAQGTPGEIFSRVDYVKSLGLDVPQTTETAVLLNQMGMPLPTVLTIDEMVFEVEKLLCK